MCEKNAPQNRTRKNGQYGYNILVKLHRKQRKKTKSRRKGQKDTRAQDGLDSSKTGGAEGNRTPVRRQLGGNFSGRSLLFTFPHPGGNKHPTGIGSFMMRGMGKAYHTHGLHLRSHPSPKEWNFRGGWAPNQAARATVLLSVKFRKLPVLSWPGATARYSSLTTPVETSTAPNRDI